MCLFLLDTLGINSSVVVGAVNKKLSMISMECCFLNQGIENEEFSK